jgi:hypothetical protein
MEHNLQLPPEYTVRKEEKLYVGELEGYGPIHGHCDMSVDELGATFDWKFPGKWSHDKVKLALAKGAQALRKGEILTADHMPSATYRYQQQLYMHGLRKLGRPIERGFIFFFPRHTNNLGDVVAYEEQYNEAMVEAAFQRLETLWGWVEAGELDEIESDFGSCYTCDTYGR